MNDLQYQNLRENGVRGLSSMQRLNVVQGTIISEIVIPVIWYGTVLC